MRVAWTITEPVSGDSYTFETNPNTQSVPFKHKIVYANRRGPSKTMIAALGVDDQPVLHLQGELLSRTMWNTLTLWFEKEYPVVIIDDLNQEWTVLIQKVSTPRVRTPSNPWHHTFTIDALVLSDGLLPADSLIPGDEVIL